jgi:hypothetical protein
MKMHVCVLGSLACRAPWDKRGSEMKENVGGIQRFWSGGYDTESQIRGREEMSLDEQTGNFCADCFSLLSF